MPTYVCEARLDLCRREYQCAHTTTDYAAHYLHEARAQHVNYDVPDDKGYPVAVMWQDHPLGSPR